MNTPPTQREIAAELANAAQIAGERGDLLFAKKMQDWSDELNHAEDEQDELKSQNQ